MSRYAYHEFARDFTMKLMWTPAFSWFTEGPKRHALQAVLAAGLSSETLSEIPEMNGLTLAAEKQVVNDCNIHPNIYYLISGFRNTYSQNNNDIHKI